MFSKASIRRLNRFHCFVLLVITANAVQAVRQVRKLQSGNYSIHHVLQATGCLSLFSKASLYRLYRAHGGVLLVTAGQATTEQQLQ